MVTFEKSTTSPDAIKTVDAREWFDVSLKGRSNITLPEANLDYFYFGTRLCNFGIHSKNLKGAIFEKADFTEDVLNSLLGVQVNLRHDKINKVVGTVTGYELADDGLDVRVRVDRDQATAHGLEPEEMKQEGYFSATSLEVSKDLDRSEFYLCDKEGSVTKKIPYLDGFKQGLRRSTEKDPFQYQGCEVAERVAPLRFTGVGIVPNPADPKAKVHALVADDNTPDKVVEKAAHPNYPIEPMKVEPEKSVQYTMGHDVPDWIDIHEEDADAMHEMACDYMEVEGKAPKKPYGDVKYADPGYRGKIKRYPLNTPGHVRAAASYFGMPKNSGKYSPEQRSHISRAIEAAKRRFGIGDENKDKASIDAITPSKEKNLMSEEDVQKLKDSINQLTADVARLSQEKETASTQSAQRIRELETELASVTQERNDLKAAKETAERESRIDALLSELASIKAFADDAEKASVREQASAILDNDVALQLMKAQRTIAVLTETAAKKDEKPKDAPKDEKKDKDEKASKETFCADTPSNPIAPTYKDEKKDKNSLDELFRNF